VKLTNACRYGIHAAAFLAARTDEQHVPSYRIAKAQHVPERFLLKVLRSLVDAGLLYSIKGPNGGYRLARPANKITLLAIIEAVDGPFRGQASFTDVKDGAALEQHLERICDQAVAAIRREVEKVRLSELVGRAEGAARARSRRD
jgi:Rrf2 family protein